MNFHKKPSVTSELKPANIKRLNKAWMFVVFVVLAGVCAYSVFKGFKKQEIKAQENPGSINVQAPPIRKEDSLWFDKEKVFNLRMADLISKKAPSPQEVERTTISIEETAYKKQLVEQEYATKLEIKKLEYKAILEQKNLEYEASRSPLSINIGTLPLKKEGFVNDALGPSASTGGQYTVPVPPSANDGGNKPDDINKQDEKISFVKVDTTKGDYLQSTKIKPQSPYELKAGTYISGVLITGINSDLPGSVVAQISENIYDTATGRYLLVPQGSKVVGEYDSRVAFGQNRALVIWEKLIFPDGSTLNLERMQGVDLSGYAGFRDKVDAHYLKIYSNALLLSIVGAGYDILNGKSQQTSDARNSVAANVGQKLSDVSSKTIENNMNVQPTITISPGYTFKIMVMKDIILENLNNE